MNEIYHCEYLLRTVYSFNKLNEVLKFAYRLLMSIFMPMISPDDFLRGWLMLASSRRFNPEASSYQIFSNL